MAAGSSSRVVINARRLLKDIGPIYKWLDDELLRAIHTGQLEMIKMRPDMHSAQAIPLTAPSLLTSTGDSDLVIDEVFEDALTNFVCYQALTKHVEYANATLASAYMSNFAASLKI
jgi:hypothetical protein